MGDTESLQTSTSTEAGLFQAVSLSRNDVNAQANLDLPLTSREHHVFGFIGDLSVNVNGAIDELSDFGLLKTLGYGINWTPIEGVNLIVSRTQDQAAPTIQQLAGPAGADAGHAPVRLRHRPDGGRDPGGRRQSGPGRPTTGR